jgi:hypothetical protein
VYSYAHASRRERARAPTRPAAGRPFGHVGASAIPQGPVAPFRQVANAVARRISHYCATPYSSSHGQRRGLSSID